MRFFTCKFVLTSKLVMRKRQRKKEVKMVSILEYDKEWEEKKLRKAEYEAGKSDGIEIGKSEGIKIGREETLAEMIYNMKQHGYSIEKMADITGKSVRQIEQYLQ